MEKNNLCSFKKVSLKEANEYLTLWNHKMGLLRRGNQNAICHMLFHKSEPIAVTTASHLIRENVGGGLKKLTRKNTIELSRLCACKPGICRVALRLWREFVFTELPYKFAVSYQDAKLHTGNTYRFDGWRKLAFSHSGTDKRSGRKGRDKWIWVWCEDIDNIYSLLHIEKTE
ncbi:MAG: hypothetical protein KAJ18_07325 [Candidatus Omnitrophica bacterium]|nr:hypothetical protein [Candidatus Omnitrophota bacterium]